MGTSALICDGSVFFYLSPTFTHTSHIYHNIYHTSHIYHNIYPNMSMSPHLSQHSHMYLYLNVKNCMNTIRGGPYKSYKKLVGSFIGTKYNIM